MPENPYFPHLFSPFKLGGLTLPNKVVMAPMSTTLGGVDGAVTEENIAFYKARVEGGFGLIIVEFTCVDPNTGRTEERQLSLDSRRNLGGHERLVQAIHGAGGKAFVQLQHGGRFSPPKYLPDGITRGPCEVRSRKDPNRVVVQPLTDGEIERLIEAFVNTATLVKEAGYDGIELHGAHGYLLSQFMSPFSNHREDRWGGDEARRMAFPLATVRAIREAIGDLPLSYRLSADEFVEGGLTIEDNERLVPSLVEAGVDILHASTGRGPEAFDKVMEPISAPEGWRLPYAARLRKAAGIPVIGVGQIRWPEKAEAALVSGDADLIALGRPSLADPAWPNKAAAGQREKIRPCTSCNWCLSGAVPHVACAENPDCGFETRAPIPAVEAPLKAVVVGAGPGGLAAALMLDEAGCNTTLIEADEAIVGGGLVPSAIPPGKDKLFWYRDWLSRRIDESGVSIKLGKRATAQDIAAFDPDMVLVAIGTQSRAMPIQGDKTALEAYEVLSQHVDPGIAKGDRVVVYGGGETGCETAEYCVEKGAHVTLITRSPADKLARSAEMIYRIGLLARLRASDQIDIQAETTLTRIEDQIVWVISTENNEERRIDADHVLIAQGRDPNVGLAKELTEMGLEVRSVGDCVQPGRIGDAVHSARAAVQSLLAGDEGDAAAVSAPKIGPVG